MQLENLIWRREILNHKTVFRLRTHATISMMMCDSCCLFMSTIPPSKSAVHLFHCEKLFAQCKSSKWNEQRTDGRTKTIVTLCLENLHLHNTIHTTYYIWVVESTHFQLFSIIGLRLNRNLYSLFLLSIRKEEAETDDNVLWLCIANGKFSIKLNEIWFCADGLLSSFSKRIISPCLFNGILWRLFHFFCSRDWKRNCHEIST